MLQNKGKHVKNTETQAVMIRLRSPLVEQQSLDVILVGPFCCSVNLKNIFNWSSTQAQSQNHNYADSNLHNVSFNEYCNLYIIRCVFIKSVRGFIYYPFQNLYSMYNLCFETYVTNPLSNQYNITNNQHFSWRFFPFFV